MKFLSHFLFFVLLSLLLANPQSALALSNPKPLDDLLLFEVQLDQSILTDGLNAYRLGEKVFLPLASLTNLLTIAIVNHPDQKTADGFIISEDRHFLLNINSLSVTIEGKESHFNSDDVRIQDDEIFVDSILFSKWFPVDLTLNISNLTLLVTPRELLPVQSRLNRSRNLSNEQSINLPDFKNFDTPYSLVDNPFIDQTFEYEISRSKDIETTSTGRYTTLITGDFLGLETHLLANGSDKKNLEIFRLSLGRDDPDGHLLGFMHARSFAFGHINTPSMPYVARVTTTGQGAFISNRLLTRPTRFDQQNFIGDLLPGWDVELFQNGILIGHQSANEKSQYEFTDIPLLFGGNDFRLVFHGPLGQIREEQSRFMLEDSMVLPGETYYSFSTVQLDDGTHRTFGQIDQSLLPRLSGTISFLQDNSSAETGILNSDPIRPNRRFYTLGLRSYLDSFFLSGDAIRSSDGGSLESMSIKTGFFNSTLVLTHVLLQHFTSEEFLPSDDPTVSSSTVRFDTFIPWIQNLPLSLTGTQLASANHTLITTTSAKISTYFDGVSISNRINAIHSNGAATTTGEVQLSSRVYEYNLRGSITYDIDPKIMPASVNLNGNINLSKDYNFTQSISNQIQSNVTRLDLGINKTVGEYGIGFTTTVTNQNEYALGTRFNVAIGVEPRSSSLFTSAQNMATTGAASVHTYIDRNANGLFDDGDLPLEGVGFQVNSGISPLRTDQKGIALVTHLPTSQRVNLAIDRATVDDPQQTPVQRGVRLLPRPGKISEIDFPFILTTEIDGVISLDQSMQPAANMTIELVDMINSNNIISQTVTAYDGYYILPEIPPGQYFLQINAEQAAELNLTPQILKTIRVLPNSNFINGLNFSVSKISKTKDIEIEDSFLQPLASTQKKKFILQGELSSENKELKNALAFLNYNKIPFRIDQQQKPIATYALQLHSENKKQAEAALALFLRYGYSAVLQDLDITLLDYFSQEEALKEKAIIMATFQGPTKIVQAMKNKILDQISIGEFSTAQQAEKAIKVLRKNNIRFLNVKKISH